VAFALRVNRCAGQVAYSSPLLLPMAQFRFGLLLFRLALVPHIRQDW